MEQSEQEQRLSRLEGLHEIHRLIAEYSHGADKRDLERFLAVWHDDAVWDVGAHRFVGREQIREAIERQWQGQPVMVHWTSNTSIDLPLGSSRATAQTDTDTMTRLDDGRWLHSAGSYQDVLEHRDGRWAFTERKAGVHFSLVLPEDVEQLV